MWVVIGKTNVNLPQLHQVFTGIRCTGPQFRHLRVQAVERACIDVENEVVDVLEHQVEGANRIADCRRYLAGTQTLIALLHYNLLGG